MMALERHRLMFVLGWLPRIIGQSVVTIATTNYSSAVVVLP
jgi:hypothetical protein